MCYINTSILIHNYKNNKENTSDDPDYPDLKKIRYFTTYTGNISHLSPKFLCIESFQVEAK